MGYYTEEILRVLDDLTGTDEIAALNLTPEEWVPPLKNIRVLPTVMDYESHPMGELWENIILPRITRQGGYDVFWGPAFLIPWVKISALKAATIHDMMAFMMPHCYSKLFAAYMRFVIRRALHTSDMIVCDSACVAADIARAFPRLKRPVHVVHPGVSDFFHAADDSQVDKDAICELPAILVIGAGNPLKNTAFAERISKRLRQDGIAHRFIVVGNHEGPPKADHIEHVSWQTRADMRRLYQTSTLFMMPSLYEGFGMPALEAMACGCPVAAARSGSLPEVGGAAALYFNLDNETDCARVIAGLLRSPERLARMRKDGFARAAEFSWHDSARRLLDLFHSHVAAKTTGQAES
ncbi:MAG: glycosyltransferase family 1 protein [Candidatus Sumerlaeota bacterium]|nr:glycosyltransferase family 1 protein [Candidatus Sumerlaeota bacterium]